MKGIRKQFNKKLYKENDQKAKEKAKKHFESKNFRIEQKEVEDYRPDLRLYKNNQFICYVECEIKHNWKGKQFPFSTIQFPERKRKYVKDRIIFFMLNYDCTNALLLRGEDLVSSPLVEVPNKFVSAGEYFFQVPVSKAIFINIE